MSWVDVMGGIGVRTRESLSDAKQAWLLIDASLIATATTVALEVEPARASASAAWHLVLPALGTQTVVGTGLGLYRGRWRPGSFDEMSGVVATGMVTVLSLALVRALGSDAEPPRALLTAAALVLGVLTAARFVLRLVTDQVMRRRGASGKHRVVVVGAGEGGEQIVRAMLRNQRDDYFPVALLDDDRGKRRLRIMGVRVAGTRASLVDTVRRYDADTVLVAIPSASAQLITEISESVASCGAQLRVLPPVSELPDRPVRVNDIRPVSYADVLGRREVCIDLQAISSYLAGKRVLVTGAGGSIGSELCRQLTRHGVGRLVMLDRDESGLHAVQLSIEGRALLDDRNLVVADIRDQTRLAEIFDEHRPHVVFHAAALKHLTLLEQHPIEAVRTNVFGTLNVLDAARAYGVDHFVNISTDKAAEPSSVLGWSKRIAERLTSDAASSVDGTYCSVRFGNVLGSRGSAIPAFQAQIDAGGPVTVTHPHVTRFFMTIHEAVRLVIQSGAIGSPGEVLILDMGEPVPIVDVVRRLMDLSGRKVDIVFTGLRAGEKLSESLFGRDEVGEPRAHPLISHVAVPPLHCSQVDVLDSGLSHAQLKHLLAALAAEPARVIDLPRMRPAPRYDGEERGRSAVRVPHQGVRF